MTAPENPSAPAELTGRLLTETTKLSNLYRNLYWLVQERSSPEQQQTLQNLDFEQIMHLKSAVDNLRDMLWKYIDAAAVVDPVRVREAAHANDLLKVTRLLQLLRDRLGRAPESQPVSFIERVSAVIQEKLKGPPGGKAA